MNLPKYPVDGNTDSLWEKENREGKLEGHLAQALH